MSLGDTGWGKAGVGEGVGVAVGVVVGIASSSRALVGVASGDSVEAFSGVHPTQRKTTTTIAAITVTNLLI